MANLIDTTYFWGELKIVGLADAKTLEEFNKFITMYEADYLLKMFGDKYPTIPTALSSLLIDSTRKISPIANYVYVKYQDNNRTATTFAGEKNLLQSNTSIADDRAKRQLAWNKMVNLNQIVHQKLYTLGTIQNGETVINYLNDILYNLNVKYRTVVLSNRTQNIQLFGGIFSMKYKEDFEV